MLCPPPSWPKVAFFCLERRSDVFASFRVLLQFECIVYARALGDHHLQRERQQDLQSTVAIHEELRSHSLIIFSTWVWGGTIV